MPAYVRTTLAAVRTLLLFTVLLGVVYPLAVTGIGQVVLPGRADGSLESVDGQVVGSKLLGQSFADAEGAPLSEWFQPRPSAGDYDPLASGASNLGPENAGLVAQIQQRRADVAAFNGVDEADVPSEAVTASGSGLDPDISPAYAYLQVARVAQARRLDLEEVRTLVSDHVRGRDLGFIGDPAVNVLQLNVALAELGD